MHLKDDYIATLVELPFYKCDALGELVEETERQFAMLNQAAVAGSAGAGSSSGPAAKQQKCASQSSAMMPPPPPTTATSSGKAPVAAM